MPTLKLDIPGEVKGLARPRASSFGGHVRMYDPSSNINEKGRLQVHLRDAINREHLQRSLSCSPKGYALDVVAYFKCPKSMSKKSREAALNGDMKVMKKPDGDNVLKTIGDAWNGILWDDDSMVTHFSIDKCYAETEHMEITVSWEEGHAD